MPLRERPRATVAVGRAGEAHFFSRGEALGERMGRQVCRPSFLPGKLLFLIRKAPANVTDNVGNSNHLWGVQCVDLMIMKKGYDLRRRTVGWEARGEPEPEPKPEPAKWGELITHEHWGAKIAPTCLAGKMANIDVLAP